MKQLGFVAVAALILWAGTAHAQVINYTEQTTASGTLGGTTFIDVPVTISFTGNLSNVTGGPILFKNSIGTGTVAVGGLGSATFTDSLYAFCNQSGTIAGISDFTNSSDILDTTNAAFSTYGLKTSIGPLTGTSTGSNGTIFPTTVGNFSFSPLTTTTYTATATPSATPEPGSIGLFVGIGASASLFAFRRRRKK